MGLSYGKLIELKSVLTTHTSSINAAYEDILRKYKGAYMPSKLPSWKDPSLFWLDDHMPYDVKVLTNGVQLESFRMLSGSTLSFWLSPALTGAYRLAQHISVRGMVQLAAMAVWQNSFEHYYLVTKQMLKETLQRRFWGEHIEDKYPLLTYCDVCASMFAEGSTMVVGGDYSPPRYPPVTFNFKMVFGSDGQKVDLLVDALMSLIDSVNEMEENGLFSTPCRSTMHPLLISTSKRIMAVLPDCELGPFRLLVFLQFCAHLSVGLTESKNSRNRLYPVVGSASHCHIVANKNFKDSHVDEICLFLLAELSTGSRAVFMDEIEPMLCNASTSHRQWEGLDVFIKGQDLFRLDEHGTPLVKEYGDPMVWSRVHKA